MLNSIADESPLAPETLTWRILRLLDDPKIASLPRLQGYLGRADMTMRFDLAERIARLFDRYNTYRTDWLTAWSQGKQPADLLADINGTDDAEWQAKLWGVIARELALGNSHPIDDFLQKLSVSNDAAVRDLPRRLSVFGLPDLPPLYLKALVGLSHHIEVDAYFLNPCREYWGDIVDQRKQLALRLKGDVHAETGNRLLAAWGHVARTTLSQLLDVAGEEMEDETPYVEPGNATVLASIQQSILDLAELDSGSLAGLAEGDQSLVVHCCHGTNRQLEVLHDALLDMFQQDTQLALDEVVVLIPNLKDVAGTIEAVFGGAPKERYIPYRITGLPLAQENPVARILLKVLQLPDSRFEASRVLDLLAEPLVARRFRLDDEDLDHIRTWIREAGIHWGFGKEDRERQSGVADSRHTFDQGIDRLLLGYALPGVTDPVVGLLPAGEIEGNDAEVLARFALAAETFAQWAGYLSVPRLPEDWREALEGILTDLIAHDDSTVNADNELRHCIDSLADAWTNAGFNNPLSIEVVRAALDDTGGSAPGAEPQGVVTFAPLASLRGLPFKVVCLLDMNDGEFPANERPAEFDLMAKQEKHRPGDRHRAQDDRGVFLDALLCAREKLLIAYNGKSPRDNKELPPSLLVAQLLDELAQACAPATAGTDELNRARKRFIVEHPLQAFSPRYFDQSDDRLFSYAQEYATALNEAAKGASASDSGEAHVKESAGQPSTEDEDEIAEDQPRFFRQPIRLSEDHLEFARNLTLDRLNRFFRNPSRYWLQQCLAADLPGDEDGISDLEPLLLDAENERLLRHRLLALKLSDRGRNLTQEEALSHALAGIELPSGPLGETSFKLLWAYVEDVAEKIDSHIQEPMLPSESYSLDLASARLSGALVGLYKSGIVRYRMDDISGSDYLSLWIEHLVLCNCQPENVDLHSVHCGQDGDIEFSSVDRDEALLHLTQLASLYHFGLMAPLPFFPKSAWAYSVEQAKGQSGMPKARNKWEVTELWPEGKDRFYRQAFRGVPDPLTAPLGPPGYETFEQLAKLVFAPLMNHLPSDEIDDEGME